MLRTGVVEIEIVLDQHSARERVVADAVSTHPGIQQRKREKRVEREMRCDAAVAVIRIG